MKFSRSLKWNAMFYFIIFFLILFHLCSLFLLTEYIFTSIIAGYLSFTMCALAGIIYEMDLVTPNWEIMIFWASILLFSL